MVAAQAWWAAATPRQLVAMAANIRVVAAVLATPPLSRFSGLDGIDGQCLRRMTPSIVEWLVFATIDQDAWRLCIRTYATSMPRPRGQAHTCRRTFAAEVVA